MNSSDIGIAIYVVSMIGYVIFYALNTYSTNDYLLVRDVLLPFLLAIIPVLNTIMFLGLVMLYINESRWFNRKILTKGK